MRTIFYLESLALVKGAVDITPDEARQWVMAHRDEPIDSLSFMLAAQDYGVDNCPMPHEGDCDCFTVLNDSDVWEIDERTGKPAVVFADWWGPFQLWSA